jgi:hypothetical protein
MAISEGSIKAKNVIRPRIVDSSHVNGCSRYESLQKNVYDDPLISKKIMDYFVPVKIDLTTPLAADEDAFGIKFSFEKDCLLLFLDHNGELISDSQMKKLSFDEKIDPKRFDSYLDMIKGKYELQ